MHNKITCFALLCQKADIEATTNVLSLHNIVTHLQVVLSGEELRTLGKVPRNINTPLDIVFVFDVDSDDGLYEMEHEIDCAVALLDPAGNVAMEAMKFQVTLPKNVRRHYFIFHLPQGVVTAFPGMHTFTMDGVLRGDALVKIHAAQPLEIMMQDATGKAVSV